MILSRPFLCLLVSLSLPMCAAVNAEEAGVVADPVTPGRHLADGGGVRIDRLLILGGSAAVTHYVGFKYFDRAWYQGQKRGSIRWLNDWGGDTYVNMDKGGHFMGGLVMSEALGEAYVWSGFGPRTAAALGTLTSWAALLEIEMRDAYFDQWGFSIPDFAFNTAGAAIPLMYELLPASRAIRFKFSYWPSRLYRDRKERSLEPVRPHTDYVIDDYEGTTFWMSLTVEEILRGKARDAWPDFLGVALGYGASGLHGSNVKSRGREREFLDLPNARPEIFLALDYDLRQLPANGPVWGSLKQYLNWIHLPAPTIRLYPDLRFYLLYM
jgi:hypothetical protein